MRGEFLKLRTFNIKVQVDVNKTIIDDFWHGHDILFDANVIINCQLGTVMVEENMTGPKGE